MVVVPTMDFHASHQPFYSYIRSIKLQSKISKKSKAKKREKKKERFERKEYREISLVLGI
jgi:Zn/Cd-binding protein ZinT